MNEIYYRETMSSCAAEESRLFIFHRDQEEASEHSGVWYELEARFVDLLVIEGHYIKIGEL